MYMYMYAFAHAYTCACICACACACATCTCSRRHGAPRRVLPEDEPKMRPLILVFTTDARHTFFRSQTINGPFLLGRSSFVPSFESLTYRQKRSTVFVRSVLAHIGSRPEYIAKKMTVSENERRKLKMSGIRKCSYMFLQSSIPFERTSDG